MSKLIDRMLGKSFGGLAHEKARNLRLDAMKSVIDAIHDGTADAADAGFLSGLFYGLLESERDAESSAEIFVWYRSKYPE